MENRHGILLDSGTNEVEFLEFLIADICFGINVLKVREIIKPIAVTKIPHSHSNVEGIIELRGEVLPVINLRKTLSLEVENHFPENKFIVSEFNGMKVILRVDHVTQIHRLTWEQMEKPVSLYQGMEDHVTGVIKLQGKMILLVDVEKILYDIYPNLNGDVQGIINNQNSARNKKIIAVAEDSSLLRKLLKDTLNSAGYEHLYFFENGKEAWGFFEEEVKNRNKPVDLLITDIEMPQMDGHHLTKKIKETTNLAHIPVVIFSSLITDHLRHKGEMVGADAQISKPQLVKLIELIDGLVLED